MAVRVSIAEHPAAAPWCAERAPEPCALVIFGASGDLTRRKIVPAILRLAQQRLLPDPFLLLGVGRTAMSDDAFHHALRTGPGGQTGAGADAAAWAALAGRIHYHAMPSMNPDAFRTLSETLAALERRAGLTGRRIFHLATPPEAYPTLVERLVSSGLLRRAEEPWTRLVIEKPFGRDLDSARALNQCLAERLRENQVFRLDHYLGKETVQNLLVFRFANAIFEPVWNRRYVDHVQITSAETVGLEHRAGYYEGTGALRDMFQNHLLQLLCLTAMEPPAEFEADRVRDEKVKIVRAIRPIPPDRVGALAVRGQYAGYRDEAGVAPGSSTETFASMKVLVDTWRWDGVPFYLRSGKRLARRATEIAVQFKPVPHALFGAMYPDGLPPNALVIRVQPEEGITLTFEAKRPGSKICLGEVGMAFDYHELFGERPPDGYERLLLDCMLGDPMLFVRAEWTEASWRFLAPVLETWAAAPPQEFPNYAAGSWGPAAADELLARDGRRWRAP